MFPFPTPLLLSNKPWPSSVALPGCHLPATFDLAGVEIGIGKTAQGSQVFVGPGVHWVHQASPTGLLNQIRIEHIGLELQILSCNGTWWPLHL